MVYELLQRGLGLPTQSIRATRPTRVTCERRDGRALLLLCRSRERVGHSRPIVVKGWLPVELYKGGGPPPLFHHQMTKRGSETITFTRLWKEPQLEQLGRGP
ncbi:putative Atp-Dependent Rna Helicase Dhx34 [Manis pentadactyla]|nr:putative Atp-Dependent Rna Helicase Dhx34 [Manis pentadactyla]